MKALKTGLYTIAAVGLAGLGGFLYLGHASKNGTAPGLDEGRLTACPSSPNCVSSEEGTEADKKVEPLPLEAWDRLPATIAEMGGKVTRSQDSYIAAEFTSATFGFVDDVEFRRADVAVHVRSASRVGHSDAGVNADRIARLRAALAD